MISQWETEHVWLAPFLLPLALESSLQAQRTLMAMGGEPAWSWTSALEWFTHTQRSLSLRWPLLVVEAIFWQTSILLLCYFSIGSECVFLFSNWHNSGKDNIVVVNQSALIMSRLILVWAPILPRLGQYILESRWVLLNLIFFLCMIWKVIKW